MRVIDTLVWRSITRWLERYSGRVPGMRHCFIRHSTAFEPQNVLVSDYDLAFFVGAGSFDDLRHYAAAIRRDLGKVRVLDPIVLPATEAAYRLCATHYVHRSLYPMHRWRRVYGEPLVLAENPCTPPPLDHSPEGFLYGYLVPVLLGEVPRHRFERTLVRRKLHRERVQFGGLEHQKPPPRLHDVVAHQVRSWDAFYRESESPPPEGRIEVHPFRADVCAPFRGRWTGTGAGNDWAAVDSVWIYPALHGGPVPCVTVNFKSSISGVECREVLGAVLGIFRGLEFRLFVGTEASMLGRLGGLSRVSLLEPWLARASGYCLYGDPDLRDRIREPRAREIREKLREYFLYLSYRVFPGTTSPYWLYALCFTVDHLLNHRELALESDQLAGIYRREFLSESGFEDADGKQRLLRAWKELHGLDLFA